MSGKHLIISALPPLFCLLLLPMAAYAGPITLNAAVDPVASIIGTPFTLSITVETGPDIEADAPLIGAKLGALCILDRSEPVGAPAPGGGNLRMYAYKASVYEPGEHEIPPVEVRYRYGDGTEKSTYTEPGKVLITGILQEAPEDIEDILQPEELKARFPWLALAGVIAAIAIFIALYAFINRRRKLEAAATEEAETVDMRPPDVIALEALERLRGEGYPSRGEFKLYHGGITAILRLFLEGRFGAPAVDWTTKEIFDWARNEEEILPVLAAFKAIFDRADMVLFAKVIPVTHESERDLDQAVRAVKAVRVKQSEDKIPNDGVSRESRNDSATGKPA